MIDTLVDYLIFTGTGLYLIAALMFLYIFIRSLMTTDGIGLLFLQILSFCVFLGSATVATVRICTNYFGLDVDVGRAIAFINPALLVVLAFYLNYLFHIKTKGK